MNCSITTRLPHDIIVDTKRVDRRDAWITTVCENTTTILGNTTREFGGWSTTPKIAGEMHLAVCTKMLDRIDEHEEKMDE